MSDLPERLRECADRTWIDTNGAIVRGGYVFDDADRALLHEAADELESMVARGGDRARMGCPRCGPDADAPLPTLRCVKCGTGFW